ncbi:hypothetical protein DPMN_140761 [Dreissena polymorpha]|uniref:Uncharacterized protein n=1 Tax=Dreissena polymorpha TaxID=45954 RepID=A0A9D4JM08_DREPO|nr:hypothetical protein DPMN_140761 [Dreissena polymorpha]
MNCTLTLDLGDWFLCAPVSVITLTTCAKLIVSSTHFLNLTLNLELSPCPFNMGPAGSCVRQCVSSCGSSTASYPNLLDKVIENAA